MNSTFAPLQVDFDPERNRALSSEIKVPSKHQASRVRVFHLEHGICRKVFFHIVMPGDDKLISFLTNLATEENRTREAANIQTSGQSVLSQFRKMRQNVPIAMAATRACLAASLTTLRAEAETKKPSKPFKSPLTNKDGTDWDPDDDTQDIPFHCDSFKMVVPDEQEYFADTRLASSQAEAAKVNSYGLRKEVDRATKCIQDGLKHPED
jgi:hypothetical protein